VTKILPCAYRSQRDNADTPGASCNTTALVMVLEASGHPPSEIEALPAGKQPEDWLTEIGDSPAAYTQMRVRCPWFFGADGKALVRPPEAPTMLDWIVEQAYGRKLTQYVDDLMPGDIMAHIDAGRAVLVHGVFTPAGHFVAVVGYEALQDVGGTVGAVTGFRINDPWGVYPAYTDHNGEHVLLDYHAAETLLKPVGAALKSGNIVV